tara:strand:+ start:37 stop:495 length:459 start_codon:yes stop_codon:yes gene_type:complete
MKKLVESGFKIAATKEGRKMAKEAFRKLFKKHKSEVKRTKKTKGAVPTIPYNLKKADLKKQIKSIGLTAKADIKAKPGLRRRILLNIEKSKRNKPKFKGPIVGKAYASDKRAKRTMMITTPKKERQAIQKSISDSVRAFMKKKTGFKKGKFI